MSFYVTLMRKFERIFIQFHLFCIIPRFSNCVQHKFVFWYSRRTPGVRSQTSYEDNIKKIVEFSTVCSFLEYCNAIPFYLSKDIVFCFLLQVEGFWVCYCHLARPASLPSPTDIHLFKEGIRPLWEVLQFFLCNLVIISSLFIFPHFLKMYKWNSKKSTIFFLHIF